MISTELLKSYDRPAPRYTSYPTAAHFTNMNPDRYVRLLARADEAHEPMSLYVHLPFCQKRCLFCACNVIVSPRKERVVDYLEHLRGEIETVAEHLPSRRTFSQLHLGGGTPTYFSPDELAEIVGHLRRYFVPTHDAELSVEVDPRVTTRAHIERLVSLGFNRISIGVQDFDPAVQEAVGRGQSLDATADLVDWSRELGIRSINFDLIYGLPKQTTASFMSTLQQAIDLAPERLAIYGFAYLPSLQGHQKRIAPATLPDRDLRFELLVLTRRLLTRSGYVDIGMDHFAKPDDPLAVAQKFGRLHRNFMGYTTDDADTMLGFGISAIGQVGGAFVQNVRKLSQYRARRLQGELATDRGVVLSEDDAVRGAVIEAIMCNFRVQWRRIAERFAIEPQSYFSKELEKLGPLVDAGFVHVDEYGVEATELGRHFLRNIAVNFDARMTTPRDQSAQPDMETRSAAAMSTTV